MVLLSSQLSLQRESFSAWMTSSDSRLRVGPPKYWVEGHFLLSAMFYWRTLRPFDHTSYSASMSGLFGCEAEEAKIKF
jgi:hypothetical protein